MTNLNCTVANCYYNKEKHCCLNGINVDGSTAEEKRATECGSFREQATEGFINGCSCDMDPKKKIDIDCKAEKCTYNADMRCTAAHVDIQGSNAKSCTETMCASFCK